MFFNAEQTQGAVGAVVPEKSAHSTGPGQESKLSPSQFPGKAAPEAAEGAAAEGAAGGAAAAGGAEAGAAGLAELAPLLLL